MTQLTAAQVTRFGQMRAEALAGTIGYWQIYQALADLLTSEYGLSTTDQTVLWLRGATEANAGRGAMSVLIREYTQTQYELRYGARLSAEQMQTASDAVAENLLADLLGDNEDRGWPKGQVPGINRIAFADATAVGFELFGPKLGHDSSDTAFSQNAAWSGSLLFSLLRSDQTGSLTSTGSAATLDTLNDLRDVLYAFRAYAKGLVAAWKDSLVNALAVAGGDVGASIQVGVDTQILGATVTGYLRGDGSATSLLQTISSGATGAAGSAFARIGEVGVNRFLDMILGAVQGRSLFGTTTDSNFESNAKAFFGALTPTELRSLYVKFLPVGADLSLTHRADPILTRGWMPTV